MDDKTQKNLLTWPVVEVDALRGAHMNYGVIDLPPGAVMKVEGGDGQQVCVRVDKRNCAKLYLSFDMEWTE